MRCSSCEPLLDRYIECTLPPRQMAGIAQHLRTCASCNALLDELRAVDGLLFTTTVPDLPQNFTFAVMAEVNALPAPRARQHPVWSFLTLYLAAAWVAAVLGMAFSGTSPRTVMTAVWNVLGGAAGTLGGLASSAAHGMGQTTPTLAAFGLGLLFLDMAVAGIIAVVYLVIRPRLAAHLVSASEASS